MLLRLTVGRLNADDEYVRRLRLGRKVQASRRHSLGHGVLKARLDNVDVSGIQLLDDLRLNIKAADLIARERKGNGCRETDVSAAHNFDFFHEGSLLIGKLPYVGYFTPKRTHLQALHKPMHDKSVKNRKAAALRAQPLSIFGSQ